jgi:hypothetical protein
LNSEGKYTWTLDPYEVLAQNLDKVNNTTGYPIIVPNQNYSWKFYAVDNVGNKSVALTPLDSDQNWKPDNQAPVFTSVVTDEPVVKEVGSKRDVTVSWEGATDYWFDPDEDPVTVGSGVDYYEFTYWTAGGAQITIKVDADDYTLDANGKKRYSVSCFVSNADYEFTITATDICGNTTKLNESISGLSRLLTIRRDDDSASYTYILEFPAVNTSSPSSVKHEDEGEKISDDIIFSSVALFLEWHHMPLGVVIHAFPKASKSMSFTNPSIPGTGVNTSTFIS